MAFRDLLQGKSGLGQEFPRLPLNFLPVLHRTSRMVGDREAGMKRNRW
jgi:hypothetical protein